MVYKAHSINLSSDIFSLSLHPTKPLLAAGLLNGRLEVYTWKVSSEEPDEVSEVEPAYPIHWGTRRYKESCRAVAFSTDGDVLFSAGYNSLIKLADSNTGKVISKAYIPSLKDLTYDYPSVLAPLTSVHLLVGTDFGRIHLYDVRESSLTRPAKTWSGVHEDYDVSSITPLPSASGGFARQFVSTGASTLAFLDFRKPGKAVISSKDQGDEQLCSTYVSGLAAKAGRGGEKVLVGNSSGVVSLWNRGEWEDHQDRINFSKSSGESVDTVAVLPESFQHRNSEWGKYIAAGSADGKVRIAKMGSNRIVETLQHLTTEEVKGSIAATGLAVDVTELGVDCEGRIVSGGGTVAKIWYWDGVEEVAQLEKENRSQAETGSDSDESGYSGDEERSLKKKRRKRRKGGTGKTKSAGPQKFASFNGLD